MGTPAYMAPEQINGEPIDARADIFAFGVLMYQLLDGIHPFQASNPLAIVGRVLNSEVAPLSASGVDAGHLLDEVVARCLRKAPADRYASAEALADALSRDKRAARVHPECVVVAHPSNHNPRPLRRRRRQCLAHQSVARDAR